jgi:hypothetical protein
MKYKLLFFAAAIVSIAHVVAFAQNADTVQPDSLYRKYKVAARATIHAGSLSKASEVFIFNPEGMYSGFVLTDNQTGKLPQLKMIYQYNNKGVLIAENDTSYSGDNYQAKKAELSYNPDGVLVKKVFKAGDEIEDETEYYPTEMKETENLYRSAKVYRIQTTWYDTHHKKIRFAGVEYADKNAQPKIFVLNGKTYTIKPQTRDENWDYAFNNSYDKPGNLIKQQRFVDGKQQDETDYSYDDRGLLIGEQDSYSRATIKFKYTYY